MNDYAAFLVDPSQWWLAAFGCILGVIGGLLLLAVKRLLARLDAEKIKEAAEARERTVIAERHMDSLEGELCNISLRITNKCEDLGADICNIREVIVHDFGERGKPIPRWRE